MSLNNISINEFVNGWIPSHIKGKIMSYALECPFKKELKEVYMDMLTAQGKAFNPSMMESREVWINYIWGEERKKVDKDWVRRLEIQRLNDVVSFKLTSKYFGMKIVTFCGYKFKNSFPINNSLGLRVRNAKVKEVKEWLTENKVKGRSQYKGHKDWKIAVKLMMSV